MKSFRSNPLLFAPKFLWMCPKWFGRWKEKSLNWKALCSAPLLFTVSFHFDRLSLLLLQCTLEDAVLMMDSVLTEKTCRCFSVHCVCPAFFFSGPLDKKVCFITLSYHLHLQSLPLQGSIFPLSKSNLLCCSPFQKKTNCFPFSMNVQYFSRMEENKQRGTVLWDELCVCPIF